MIFIVENTFKMNTLKEIKSGNTGYGLLVENDGYISMHEGKNQELLESYRLNENIDREFKCPYPFIVSAVFQKYGVKNANGRIYPEEVLKREVAKYQQAINERRAYGECYTPDAMVFTTKGWVNISDVKEGDNVFTLNTNTNEIEIQPVSRKIERKHNGKLIRIKGNNIDDLVTPEHGFPLYSENKDFKLFCTAENLKEKMLSAELSIPTANETFSDIVCDKIMIKDLTISEENYEGEVMCIEVPNHTWYVMQNGKCHWTKNCNHPLETSIDVGRICLNIIELHWEGKTLVGKMEIPITEAFRKTGAITCLADQVAHFLLSGLKLGVSSRGVGNVEEKYGTTIVTDYELICWDLVSQPSTPGAWIGQNEEELKPYMESIEKKNNLIIDNLQKFDTWLN